jgi:hypothetical protein
MFFTGGRVGGGRAVVKLALRRRPECRGNEFRQSEVEAIGSGTETHDLMAASPEPVASPRALWFYTAVWKPPGQTGGQVLQHLASSAVSMVAGAGFEPATFGL